MFLALLNNACVLLVQAAVHTQGTLWHVAPANLPTGKHTESFLTAACHGIRFIQPYAQAADASVQDLYAAVSD